MELRQTRKKVIEGTEYEVTQLGAIAASRVFVRVMRLLGPAMRAKNLMAGAGEAISSLEEDDVEWLCQQFAPLTGVKGQGQLDKIFDIHFTGKIKAMMLWLGFCLEVNFSDFLGGRSLDDVLAQLGQKKDPSLTSSSQKDATGPAGVS